jgi:hypothetical protein
MTKVGQKKFTWSRYLVSQSVIWCFDSKSIRTLSPYFGALVIHGNCSPLTTRVHWVVKIKWETDWMLSPAPIIIIGESKAVTSFYVPPWRRNFRGTNCVSHYLTDMHIRVPLHSSIFLTKFSSRISLWMKNKYFLKFLQFRWEKKCQVILHYLDKTHHLALG